MVLEDAATKRGCERKTTVEIREVEGRLVLYLVRFWRRGEQVETLFQGLLHPLSVLGIPIDACHRV
jgi:hypothetical protein